MRPMLHDHRWAHTTSYYVLQRDHAFSSASHNYAHLSFLNCRGGAQAPSALHDIYLLPKWNITAGFPSDEVKMAEWESLVLSDIYRRSS